MSFDRRSRTYFPTPRLSIMTRWIQGALFADGRLMALMGDLLATTGETVVLGIQNDLDAQYIHILPGTQPIMLSLPPGTLRPLFASGMGWALLSSLPDEEVRQLAEIFNARGLDAPVDIDALLTILAEVRRRGYARSYGSVIPSSSMLAMPLPRIMPERPVAIGVGGPIDRVREREAELVGMLRAAIARHFPGMADSAR
jgi:DNA-binding IclR family transcriptional regulator